MVRPAGGGDGDADADGTDAGAVLDVEDHYDRPGLVDRLLSGLAGGGVDPAALDREHLAGVTEFHLRGRRATRDLADAAGLGDGDRVVDAGAGLGGPGLDLVLGDRFGEMTRTMYRNLEEDRLSTFRGVFELDPSS